VPSDQRRRSVEIWPLILAGLLIAMIGISTTFAWVAHRLPDPEVVDEAYERSGGEGVFRPRLVTKEGS